MKPTVISDFLWFLVNIHFFPNLRVLLSTIPALTQRKTLPTASGVGLRAGWFQFIQLKVDQIL